MEEMVVADQPNKAFIVSHESSDIQNEQNGQNGRPTIGKIQEWHESSDALEGTFEPVAFIRVPQGRNNILVMDAVNRIQGSCVKESVADIEPDVITKNG
jgi:hypothetical protein